jgi:hypothetical protein
MLLRQGYHGGKRRARSLVPPPFAEAPAHPPAWEEGAAPGTSQPVAAYDARQGAASVESGKEPPAIDPLAGEEGEGAQPPDLAGDRAPCRDLERCAAR